MIDVNNIPPAIIEFVTESNRIESIYTTTEAELEAHVNLLNLPTLWLGDIEAFVAIVAGERIRNRFGMDVRVGRSVPRPGGVEVVTELREILASVNSSLNSPYENHLRYEKLHPFMDGNGRSGRAIWLWQMLKEGKDDPFQYPFLQWFYYQSLEHYSK
jgi:hypothetical protein